jgi:integrase
MGLGALSTLSLADAREQARTLRANLKHPTAPVDPLQRRVEEKDRLRLEAANRATFAQCAELFLEAHSASWTNPKHRAQWSSTLTTYAFPVLGALPVSAITTALVMRALEPIWTTKTETAARLRGRIESVLDWATVRGYRQGENPARWKGHLDQLLPGRAKVAPVEHHAAIPFNEIHLFMHELQSVEGVAALALQFTILTAARSGETRLADWDEIDLNEKVWLVPAARMKAGREHRVPLSDRACSILTALPHRDGLLFHGRKPNTALSDMSLTAVMRRMGRTETVHGFRSAFRDWASEKTTYDGNIAEAALAHVVGNKVEAAYRRGDLFEKRRHMMNDWARWCAKGEGEKVVLLQVKA